MTKILVAGSGGFIGGHLVARLIDDGFSVRAVDIKALDKWWQAHKAAENIPECDLRLRHKCMGACHGVEQVYNLAADMGGIGHIETHRADCALHNVLINSHMLLAGRFSGVKRFLLTSSACVYAAAAQDAPDMPALKESDAWPSQAEPGYGEEKLFAEQLCRYAQQDYGLETRVLRLHNVYGPRGSWRDGREKAPAAICRKVAQAKASGKYEIEIWGDGNQTRSFMYVDDCVEGLRRIMDSDFAEPINLGSAEQVTINELVDIVEQIAATVLPGVPEANLKRNYDSSQPQGVRGRSSDNSLIKQVLDWQPTTPLWVGLQKTYRWIDQQVRSDSST